MSINTYYYAGTHCKKKRKRQDDYQLQTIKADALTNVNSSLLPHNNEIIEEDRHIIQFR